MSLPLRSSLSPVSLFSDSKARSSGASLSTADGRALALVGVRLRGAERAVRASPSSFAKVLDVEAVLQEALLRVWQVAPRSKPTVGRMGCCGWACGSRATSR